MAKLNKKQSKAKKKDSNEMKKVAFRKKIKFLSAHAGFCTLFCTLGIGAISGLLKGFLYVLTCGKLDYWGISHSYIITSNENALYELFFYAAVAIGFVVLNAVPFLILTSKRKWYMKTLYLLALIILTVLIIFIIICNFDVSQLSQINFQGWLWLAVELLKITGVLYFIGVACALVFLGFKIEVTTVEPFPLYKICSIWVAVIFIVFISIYMLIIYMNGKNLASQQRIFKTVTENTVVIYEDAENYIISDCLITGKSIAIDSATQILIKKQDIKTVTANFDDVQKKSL